MTETELKTIEAELQRRGYRKYTTALTSSESWAWFKAFDKRYNEDGGVIGGYQVAFRVWDWRPYMYRDPDMNPYGLDFWTSALGCDGRMDFTSNWEPICDLDTFEHMAEDFNKLTKKYTNGNK